MTSSEIAGLEGLNQIGIEAEMVRGARYVVYLYTISIAFMTFKRSSKIYFVRAGKGRAWSSLPYTLVPLLFGWWGIPWGSIYTVQSIAINLAGGQDVTAHFASSPPRPTQR